MRKLIAVLAAALMALLTTALGVVPADAAHPGHNAKGVLFFHEVGPNTWNVVGDAYFSHVSGLGRVTYQLTLHVDVGATTVQSTDPKLGYQPQSGSLDINGTLTAADGSTLQMTSADISFAPNTKLAAVENLYGIVLSPQTMTLSAGTGRFDGVSGEGRVVDGGFCVVNRVGYLVFQADLDFS
jgi:hypothetical protein